MPPSQQPHTLLSGGHDFYLFSDPTWTEAHKAWALEIIACRVWLLDPLEAYALGLYPPPAPQNPPRFFQ